MTAFARSQQTTIAALGAAILLASAMPASGAVVDPATFSNDDVGPPTTYGETPAEAAAKKVVFEWNYMTLIERNPRQAFATYVGRNWCDHGHLATAGRRECVGYDEAVADWSRRFGQSLKSGERVEIPTMATVDGEMVTMYGAGVDIFRVHEGKITDHWDASPPADVTLKAHKPTFLTWLLGERKGPPPDEGPSISVVTVDEKLLNSVAVGPVSAYGETPQEAANKRLLFEFNHLAMIAGKPRAAFEKYVSQSFCGHGHLSTRMQKECGTYSEQLEHAIQFDKPRKPGDQLELPTLATVDGEMVTMYGAGVDIFRVHDGKITEHWDASPPADVQLKAHSKQFAQRMSKVVAGEMALDQALRPGPD